MKVTAANGVAGVLIFTGDEFMLRVYGDKHDFIDYHIFHNDLAVKIIDESASFYVGDDGEPACIDYSPDILNGESA